MNNQEILNINDFFNKSDFELFKEYDKKNYWFGGTKEFSKIYKIVIESHPNLIKVENFEELMKFLNDKYGQFDKLKVDSKLVYPFFYDINLNIYISYIQYKNPEVGKGEKRDIYYVDIDKKLSKSIFGKKNIIDFNFKKEVENGGVYTHLFFIKLFREQFNKFENKDSIEGHKKNNKSFKSKLEVLSNYDIKFFEKICELIDNTKKWTYNEQYGGLRINKQDNFLDFVGSREGVIQFILRDKEKDIEILWMDINSEEKPISSQLSKKINVFLDSGNTSELTLLWENQNKKFKQNKVDLIDELDKDKNGTIDVIEGVDEFNQLMKKNQKSIIEKQRVDNNNYSNQLIKISNYIGDKKHNLQELFQRIKETKNKENLDVLTKIISNEVHVYNLILFNSLNLLVSIIDDDLFTYNDIYEKFDKMNIFNSNFENEISKKLDDLNLNLVNLMFEIDIMGRKVVNSINHLSYVTEESSKRLEYHLKEINSGIESNNFLSTIQTYQLYKINKNTKSLRN